MKRQLAIIAGPDKGRCFPLEDGQTLFIGRGEASACARKRQSLNSKFRLFVPLSLIL